VEPKEAYTGLDGPNSAEPFRALHCWSVEQCQEPSRLLGTVLADPGMGRPLALCKGLLEPARLWSP